MRMHALWLRGIHSSRFAHMAFLKKTRNQSEPDLLIPALAASCMESAYWLFDYKREEETLAPHFYALLGCEQSAATLGETLRAMPDKKAVSLLYLHDDLLAGRIVEPVMLESLDGARMLYAMPHQLQGMDARDQAVMIWIYDITPVTRQQQRTQQENAKLKLDIKHYSTLLNMAPYPIWERGRDLGVRFYNLAYGEIAEESGSEGAPELDRRARQLASIALESGQPRTERRHLVVGGQRRLFQFNEQPLPEEGLVIGYAHDISEVESLQEELQRYMSAQADLLESSASAMAIYGPDMRLKSFNYAFVNLWKLDENWLEEEPSYGEVLESLRERRALPEQANFQMFKQSQVKLFTDLIEPREEFFYLPDGRTLRVIAIPHALGGILFAYEDVTDRLALERSYNTLIAVQRETLDHLHEAIAVFGEDGRLKLSNPVYLSLWGLDAQVAGAEPHITALIDRAKPLYLYDDWEAFRALRIADIHTRVPMRSRLELANGKVLDCTSVPLPDGATLITYLDVTDSTLVERSLRERNEALQEADRLKTQFLANVSYELRSPLTSISGFSDMLLSREYFGELNEKQREYVEGIHQSSQHLMQLVNDILDLASIEAGYMQLELRHFTIPAMMKSVLALTSERAREHQLKVTLDCQKGIGAMDGDETRIKQILFNLLSNAIRFTPPGGKIVLGAKAEGEDNVVLWVSDEGPGIPLEERERVFDKFYKGDQRDLPKSKSKSGTGLGLSMVKSFVELHGGRVELDSQPGVGTTVSCVLPRNKADAAAKAAQKQ